MGVLFAVLREISCSALFSLIGDFQNQPLADFRLPFHADRLARDVNHMLNFRSSPVKLPGPACRTLRRNGLLPVRFGAMPREDAMLNLTMGLHRSCDRVTRRELLKVGSLAALGISLPGFLERHARAGTRR